MIVFIVVWLVFAYTCYMVAIEKGLNANFWAVVGVIFGIFALVIVSLAPNRNKR